MATEHNNNIYNEDIYSKVLQENKDILHDYQLELKARKRAPSTISQYSYDVKMVYCFIYENFGNCSILDLKKRSFRNFFLFLDERGVSSSRINRVMSSLRAMLEYCAMDDDYYPDYIQNPMKQIRSVDKEVKKEVVFLEDEQITFLINYLIKQDQTQKALFLSLAYDSAARRTEVWGVEKHSFLNDDEFKTNLVDAKRGKRYSLMYGQRTRDIAKQYLSERGHDDLDELFITGSGITKRPITSETLYIWCVGFRAILENEYDKNIPMTAHSIRHTSLQNYKSSTHYNLKSMGVESLDLNTLKMLAQHNDISTTESYLKDESVDILDNLFGNA